MIDVAVVGAGPVGLLTALGLAQAGLEVQVLEAAHEPSSSPRALVYHWAVMEGLDQLGVLQDVIREGVVKQDYAIRVFETGETIRWSIAALEGLVEHPFNVHLGQHVLARILLEHLERLPNCRIRWCAPVVGLTQDEGSATLRISAETGPEEVTARWVVAADGARSAVRGLLGLSFEGMTWPKSMVATNIRADLDGLGMEQTVFMLDQVYGAIIVKIDDRDTWRVTYSEPGELPEEGITKRMPTMFERILPGLGDNYQLLQYSPYRMHQRAADRFVVGRVLMAGDAAHITNPVGGLGLTAGIFDGFAIRDALVAVLRGDAPEEILGRLARERRDNFLEVTSPQATENNRLLFYSDDVDRLERDLDQVRKLASSRQAVLNRTLFVGRLRTPLLTAREGVP